MVFIYVIFLMFEYVGKKFKSGFFRCLSLVDFCILDEGLWIFYVVRVKIFCFLDYRVFMIIV